MALRLRVIGPRAESLGDSVSTVFGVNGGSLGRAEDNDWILPDPERYVSGHHARIDYREGAFALVDISSNGTYINDVAEPLQKNVPQALNDGDRLRIGDYEIVITIDPSNDFPPDSSAIVAHDGVASAGVRRATEDDLGEDLDLDALLTLGEIESSSASFKALGDSSASNIGLADSSGARPVTPVNAYGLAMEEAAIAPRRKSTATAPKKPAGPKAPAASTTDAAGKPKMTWNLATRRIEPFRNPARATAEPAPAKSSALDQLIGPDPLNGFQAVCRGAGIDPASLPTSVQPQLMQIAGQVLREVVLGLIDVTQTRTELKNRYRIAQPTTAPAQINPLQQAVGVDEALRQLFDAQGKTAVSSRYMGIVDAIRDCFQESKTHHQALAAAQHSAVMGFLARLDPEELQERFDRGLKRGGLLAATNKMKYWDLYGEFYHSLSHTPKDELPHLFVEEFAKAYEAKLAELATRRQRAAGSASSQ